MRVGVVKQVASKRRIAFVYARPGLNNVLMKYMPFGMSTLRILAREKNIEIDFYVTETQDSDYEALLPINIRIIYLENRYIFRFGLGIGLFATLSVYFWYKTLFKRYAEVWGNGQVGNVLASRLAKKSHCDFILLNDEFPDVYNLHIWYLAEICALKRADWIIEPDESRFSILNGKLDGILSNKNNFVFPNIPLQSDTIETTQVRNFKQELKIPSNDHIFLYAGGMSTKAFSVELILSVFPYSAKDCHLVMVGSDDFLLLDQFTHKRIHWIIDPLSDEDLHSLIQQSTASIGFYSKVQDMEFAGKSSGKVMRSLMFYTPVIVPDFVSFQFVKDDGMGVLIEKPFQINNAFETLKKQRFRLQKNIKKNIHKYYFESYWKKFRDENGNILLNK